MALTHVFIWVREVQVEAGFFRDVFALPVRVLEEVPGHGWRAELDAGPVTVYVADEDELGGPGEIGANAYRNDPVQPPAAFQISFTVSDVAAVHAAALTGGGSSIADPYVAPWGQTLARLRTPGGVVVSLIGTTG